MNFPSVGNQRARIVRGSPDAASGNLDVIHDMSLLNINKDSCLRLIGSLRRLLPINGFKFKRVTAERTTGRVMILLHRGGDPEDYVIHAHNRTGFPFIFWNYDVFVFKYKGVTFFGLVIIKDQQPKLLCLPDTDDKELLCACVDAGWQLMPSLAVRQAQAIYEQFHPGFRFSRAIQANEDFCANFAIAIDHHLRGAPSELASWIREEYLAKLDKNGQSQDTQAHQDRLVASPPLGQNRRRRIVEPTEDARPQRRARVELEAQDDPDVPQHPVGNPSMPNGAVQGDAIRHQDQAQLQPPLDRYDLDILCALMDEDMFAHFPMDLISDWEPL